MNKRILLSVMTIGVVLAMVGGATRALFSDTETSVGNTFSAGTIDISVDDQNPWTDNFELVDMKPCYTDYINFTIKNVGSNPANIWKKLHNIVTGEGVMSEPECDEYGGTWVDHGDRCSGGGEKHDIQYYINYDLLVEVYDAADAKVWWQTIYVDSDDVTVAEIAAMADGVYLGMLPVGYTMKVTQSYHMIDSVTNWAQGDEMSFDISLEAKQLTGMAWLENKKGAEPWKLNLTDDIKGVVEYEVKNPTFEFEFSGKAQLANTEYYLVAGGTPSAGGWDPDTKLGSGTSDSSGNLTFSGDAELDKHLKNVKLWLVPSANWSGGAINWPSPWTNSYNTFLWEVGMIWYEDTDL